MMEEFYAGENSIIGTLPPEIGNLEELSKQNCLGM
jgi:hypothetical protein